MSYIIYSVCGRLELQPGANILAHEHIMVDFIGADKTGPERWDRAAVIARMLPYLQALHDQNINLFFDCTPNYLGRDPVLLRDLSQRSGIQIVTNTGLYKDQYIPAWGRTASVDELAARWIAEYTDGIEGTDIRPGFIKTAVNPGPLNEEARRCIRAAAVCSRETGLTVATHCGDAVASHQILDILESEGVPPEKWILVHSQLVQNDDELLGVAARGPFIELDGLAWGDYENHATKLRRLVDGGYANRTLLSQDAGWYHVGEENGGEVIGYTALIGKFLPYATPAVAPDILETIMTRNPLEAYAIRR